MDALHHVHSGAVLALQGDLLAEEAALRAQAADEGLAIVGMGIEIGGVVLDQFFAQYSQPRR